MFAVPVNHVGLLMCCPIRTVVILIWAHPCCSDRINLTWLNYNKKKSYYLMFVSVFYFQRDHISASHLFVYLTVGAWLWVQLAALICSAKTTVRAARDVILCGWRPYRSAVMVVIIQKHRISPKTTQCDGYFRTLHFSWFEAFQIICNRSVSQMQYSNQWTGWV